MRISWPRHRRANARRWTIRVALMMMTRTVHPPAGSNPVIVFLTQPEWSFLFFPTLVGSFALVAVALVYNNVTRKANYPKYW